MDSRTLLNDFNITITSRDAISGNEITRELNVDILSEKELYEWKKNNFKLEHADLNVLFPSECGEKYLIDMFKNINQYLMQKLPIQFLKIQKQAIPSIIYYLMKKTKVMLKNT